MEVWSNEMMGWKVPEFGNWGYYEGLPITHYLESANQAGFIRTDFCGDEDLFNVPVAMPVKCRRSYAGHYRQKARKTSSAETEKNYTNEHKQRKHRKVCNAADCPSRRPRAPMAVDEDLYKIPPELLDQKPKTKRMLKNLLCGCMGLNCH